MVRTRFALILYFCMVAHKTHAILRQRLFLNRWRHGTDSAGVGGILRLKICSLVLLPALNPACSSAIISSAWGLSLFKIIFCMTLLE